MLPERATRERYLVTTIRRLGDLPDDPDRVAYAITNRVTATKRLAWEMSIGVAPLAAYVVLHHFSLIPGSADVPALTLSLAWLATVLLNAIRRRYPEETAGFFEALSVSKSMK